VAQLSTLGILAAPFMKSKQLANVLIKILGLSVIVHGTPTIVMGFISALPAARAGAGFGAWIYLLSSVAVVVIGLFLIIQSRAVADFLFKGDDE
jgi:hypothetical protein